MIGDFLCLGDVYSGSLKSQRRPKLSVRAQQQRTQQSDKMCSYFDVQFLSLSELMVSN